MKKLFAVLLCLFMVFSLCSCGDSYEYIDDDDDDKSSSKKKTEESTSPIDGLNNYEKDLFDAVIVMSESFQNPTEMRVLDVGDYEFDGIYDTLIIRMHSGKYYKIYLKGLMGKALAEKIAEDDIDKGFYKEKWDKCKADEYPRSSYDTFEEYIKHKVEYYLRTDFFHNEEERDKKIENDAKYSWDTCKANEYPKSYYSTYTDYLDFCYKFYREEYFVVENYDKTIPAGKDEKFGTYISVSVSSIKVTEPEKYNVSKINQALKYYWDQKLGNT